MSEAAGPAQAEPVFVEVGADARRIAVLKGVGRAEADAPGFVWLGGYRSDMAGGKATTLAEWAARAGRAVTRLDYSGHGRSGGAFEDGTLQRWIEEAAQVLLRETRGPQILVGSSMGGWIALKLAEAMREEGQRGGGRIAGLLLIAPAWNMASLMWDGLSEAQRETLMCDGIVREASAYGETVVTRRLVEEGRALEWTDGPVRVGVPVRILQGLRDADVPAAHVMKLLERLEDEDVRLTLVKDGDHRLSEPAHLDMLLRVAAGF